MLERGLSAAEAFRRACSDSRADIAETFLQARSALIGCTPPGDSRVVLFDEAAWGDARRWFFIGDIHGDFHALHGLVEAMRAAEPDFRLVFLGDLVDRGPHALECCLYLLDLAIACPGRVMWIAGNHDIGLAFDAASGRFFSGVDPAEFADALNDCDGLAHARQAIGRSFIELVNTLPRAALSPDGLMITHGGFPHSDLQQQCATLTTRDEILAWVNTDSCLKDFTWTRITRWPKKIPNRESSGCSYGFNDFAGFVKCLGPVAMLKRLLTGHDHPDGGYSIQASWQDHPALTLTGYGFGNEYGQAFAWQEGYREQLFLGRGIPDSLPEVMAVAIDREALASFFECNLAGHFSKAAECANG